MKDVSEKKVSVTILLPAGRLPGVIMVKVIELAAQYDFKMYLSTAQNLRLFDIKEGDLTAIKADLTVVGAEFKGPGKFPLPRVCIGKQSCNLGIVDTEEVSARILDHCKGRGPVKPKFKIAVSGCPAMCSGPITTDIGVVATRAGFDIYAGGKGGPRPCLGRRIGRSCDMDEMLDVVAQVIDFHSAKTSKKQRMSKLMNEPDFPFPEIS